MEFLTPQQKRSKSRQLFIGYGLFSILILLATYIMVSTAFGFEIFSTKGEVIQNGLLFVDSKPASADVYINGKKEADATNTKLSLPEGIYDVNLKKEGFRDWSSSVKLFGGAVKFLTYPRLLPLDPLKISESSLPSSVSPPLQSRDKRWLALYSVSEPTQLRIYDIDKSTELPTLLSLPLNGTVAAKDVELIEWAGDNSHILLKTTYQDSSTKFFVLNREKVDEISDVSAFVTFPARSMTFWDGKSDQIVVTDQLGTAWLASTKDKSVDVSPLINEATTDFYALSEKRAVYTVKSADGSVYIKMYDDSKTYTVLSLPASDQKLVIKGAGFNRNDYLAIAGGGLEKALVYKNVINTLKQSDEGKVYPFVTFPIGSDVIDFSRGNRFVAVHNATESAVYDFEQKELVRYTSPIKDMKNFGWFDDSRLFAQTSANALHVYDFNGNNVYELEPNLNGYFYVNQSVEKTAFVNSANGAQTLQVINIASQSK